MPTVLIFLLLLSAADAGKPRVMRQRIDGPRAVLLDKLAQVEKELEKFDGSDKLVGDAGMANDVARDVDVADNDAHDEGGEQEDDEAMAQLGLDKLTKMNLVNFAKMVGGTRHVQLVDEHMDNKTLLDVVHQGLRTAFLEEEEEEDEWAVDACEDCSMKTKLSGRWCSSVPDDQESQSTCPNFYSREGVVCIWGTKNGKTRCLNNPSKRCCTSSSSSPSGPSPTSAAAAATWTLKGLGRCRVGKDGKGGVKLTSVRLPEGQRNVDACKSQCGQGCGAITYYSSSGWCATYNEEGCPRTRGTQDNPQPDTYLKA